MTRVNVVDPSHLTNKHLMAEYREMPRIITAVEKAIKQGKTPKDFKIPDSYRFGTGHVTFFYDKLNYINERMRSLKIEIEKRKFKIDPSFYVSCWIRYRSIPLEWRESTWKPTPEDIYLNMARLVERQYKTAMRVEGREVLEPVKDIELTKLNEED